MRAWFACFVFAACSPFNPNLPAEPFLCGDPNHPPICPEGFSCQTVGTPQVCVDTTGTAPDGGGGDGSGGFQCQDDHMVEPNDTLANAFQTPVASQLMTIKFAM